MTDYKEFNCDLFGDGCGGVILGPTQEKDKGILATHFMSDVSGIRFIYKDKLGMLRMPQGPKVFAKATRGMVEIAHRLTEKTGILESEITKYIPHQANGRILDYVEDKVDPGKTGRIYRNIQRYGNMSAATVPVALAEAIQTSQLKKNDLAILVDMGSGLAFGGALVRV